MNTTSQNSPENSRRAKLPGSSQTVQQPLTSVHGYLITVPYVLPTCKRGSSVLIWVFLFDKFWALSKLEGICNNLRPNGLCQRKDLNFARNNVFHAHPCMLSRFSCVRLYVTPWTTAHQPVHGTHQVRTLEWVPCPPPGIFPTQGLNDVPYISCTDRQVLYH